MEKSIFISYGEFMMKIIQTKEIDYLWYGHIYFVNGRTPEELETVCRVHIEDVIMGFVTYIIQEKISGVELTTHISNDDIPTK